MFEVFEAAVAEWKAAEVESARCEADYKKVFGKTFLASQEKTIGARQIHAEMLTAVEARAAKDANTEAMAKRYLVQYLLAATSHESKGE